MIDQELPVLMEGLIYYLKRLFYLLEEPHITDFGTYLAEHFG